ncbi:MAG: DUF3299 domain-containing protein [Pseudomonadota bacterium]
MVRITRRKFGLAGAAALVAGRAAASTSPIELEWRDLIPEDERGNPFYELIREMGIVQHGELSSPFDAQDRQVGITREYDDKQVRLPGYSVPLSYDGTGITELLLVPYIGACIHVPPPPPNQIVFVTLREPYEMTGFFEPVFATGTFSSTVLETELAELGYVISEGTLEPYE